MQQEPGTYNVIIKDANIDPAEADVRLGKAFDMLFDEILARRRRQKKNHNSAADNAVDAVLNERSSQS